MLASLIAVVTLPDWASACWPRWAARHNSYYAGPTYYEPAYYPAYHSYPVEVPCYPQVYVAPPATNAPLARAVRCVTPRAEGAALQDAAPGDAPAAVSTEGRG